VNHTLLHADNVGEDFAAVRQAFAITDPDVPHRCRSGETSIE
jgi:hypothetical protein